MSDDIGDRVIRHYGSFLILTLIFVLFLSSNTFSAPKKRVTRPVQRPIPAKVKMLWLDAEENVFLLSSQPKVAAVLDKCSKAGINAVAVDIKPYSGYVLYNSKIAPKMTRFKGQPYPENYDLLRTLTVEAHKRGIKVHAALNIFSEGLKATREGPAYSHPDWQVVNYNVSYFLKTSNDSEEILYEQNQRTTEDTLTFFTPDYGKKLFRRDEPGNAIDGNVNSPSSKWTSNSQEGPHWIALEWNNSPKIDSVRISFIKNYIVRSYRIQALQNGRWIDLTRVINNRDIVATSTFLPLNTKRIRIYIEDPGNDTIARIQEIEVFSTQGSTNPVNLALNARATADSHNPRNNADTFYIVRNNSVSRQIVVSEFPNDGIDIPSEGYVISANGKTRNWAYTNLSEGTRVSRSLRTRLVPTTELPGMLVYVNPSHPVVRQRALDIIEEVVKNYNIDGIVLDRVRYDNFKVDFSDLTRRQFEHFIGQTIRRWPEDIYQIVPNPNGNPPNIVPGMFYKEWVYWRASNIKDFMIEARNVIKDTKPNVSFGDYVGGWYPEYYEVGVNWASYKYDPSRDYDWATPAYRGTGYAEYLDYLCPGLYYPDLSQAESIAAGKPEWANLDSGLKMVDRVVGDATKVYSSLYYPNISKPETFKKAVRMSLNSSDGIMIFAMVNFEKSNSWDLLQEALSPNNLRVSETQFPSNRNQTRTITKMTTPIPVKDNDDTIESFSLRSIFRIPISWFD